MFLSLGLDLDRIAVLDLGDGAAVADDVAGVIATVIPKGTGRGRLPQRAVAEENLAAVPILGGGVTAGPVDKVGAVLLVVALDDVRSEEHTSELQSLMRISYAVFGLKQKKQKE